MAGLKRASEGREKVGQTLSIDISNDQSNVTKYNGFLYFPKPFLVNRNRSDRSQVQIQNLIYIDNYGVVNIYLQEHWM